MKNIFKKGFVWVLSLAILLFLFLASSTNLIIGDDKEEIYNLSVIIGDETDDDYTNFRKGIEQAAIDLHADVNFVTLYNNGSWEQQKTFILREIEDGADGLILAPTSSKDAAEFNSNHSKNTPVIFINDEIFIQNSSHASNITFDFTAMGTELAEKLQDMDPETEKLCFVSNRFIYGSRKLFYNSIDKELPLLEKEIFLPSYSQLDEKEISRLFETDKKVTVIALDSVALCLTASVLEKTQDTETMLYGLGSSVSALNYLRKGIVSGLYVVDDYAQAYQCVQSLIDKIDHPSTTLKNSVGNYYYIDKDILDSDIYDTILYPME